MSTAEENRPRLRPLSLGEILDVSIKICLAHWRTLLKAVLVVIVPVQIVSTIVNADYTVSSAGGGSGSGSSLSAEETLRELNQYLGGLAISSVLQVCAVLLATAACFRAIAQAYLGEETDWRGSLGYALRRAPSLLLITLLYLGGVVIATMAFVVPGIWLYVAWAFAAPVLLVEGLRGPAALGRSFALVRERWWRTFAVIAVGFILAAVISTLVQAVFLIGIVAGSDNDLVVLVLSGLAGTVGLAVSTPLQAAILAVVYFDLRVRKEGFDLELLARGVGATVPSHAIVPPADRPPAGEPGGAGTPPPPGWRAPDAEDAGAPPPRRREDPPPDGPRLPGVPHG